MLCDDWRHMPESSLPRIRLQRFLSDDFVAYIALNFPDDHVDLMKEVVEEVCGALSRLRCRPTLSVLTLTTAPIVLISIHGDRPQIQAVDNKLRSIRTATFVLANEDAQLATEARVDSLRLLT